MGFSMVRMFVLLLLLFTVQANACMVDKGWEKRTADKADKNKDGKIDYAEYKAMHSWSAADEQIAKNNWNSELETVNKYTFQTGPDGKITMTANKSAKKRDYLTVKEFVSGERPKCGK